MGTASSGVAFARPLPLTGEGVRRGIPVVAALHGLGYALLEIRQEREQKPKMIEQQQCDEDDRPPVQPDAEAEP